ncbi:MAG: hypothetical protein ACP5JH_11485 [Bacteroidota bacterium]
MALAAVFSYLMVYIWMSALFFTILIFLKSIFARFGEVNATMVVAFFSILLFSIIINARLLPYFTGFPLVALTRDVLLCLCGGNLACSINGAFGILVAMLGYGFMAFLVTRIRLRIGRRDVVD